MYVTMEGPEATGKSTQAKLLAEALEREGRKVFLTKEPGSPHDPFCVKIRSLLLDPENEVAKRAAFFLFLADRAQHMETIKQKLDEGFVVVSDRSSLSTYVYHAAAISDWYLIDEGLSVAIDYAQQVAPDICFVCLADFDWSMNKLKERRSLDRIEQFDLEFHRRTHKFFGASELKEITTELALSPKEIIHAPLASNMPLEDIYFDILSQVKERLNGL